MSQLHFYVPDDVEQQIRLKAKQANLPLSKYLAQIVKRETLRENKWPIGYLALFDNWKGEPQTEPIDLPPENRDRF